MVAAGEKSGVIMVMPTVVGSDGIGASRRTLYRHTKRMLVRLLVRRWKGPRHALEPAVRRFLRARPRSFLVRLAGDRAFALAAAAALLATPAAEALPPVNLSDVVAGSSGFVINGIDPGDYSGWSVSGASDVNGDGLADLLVGAPLAGPGFFYAGESYVVFGRADGTPVELADVAAGSGGFVINGIESGDRSGRIVSGAGDVNGDGLADLVVGAPGCSHDEIGQAVAVHVTGTRDARARVVERADTVDDEAPAIGGDVGEVHWRQGLGRWGRQKGCRRRQRKCAVSGQP